MCVRLGAFAFAFHHALPTVLGCFALKTREGGGVMELGRKGGREGKAGKASDRSTPLLVWRHTTIQPGIAR